MDDGTFRRGDRWASLAAVRISLPGDVEAVRLGRVRVDGLDATASIRRLLRRGTLAAGARAVLLDGISFGGFNLVDLDELHRDVHLPILAVTRRPPELRKIRAALRTYFPRSFRTRWGRIQAHRLFRVPTGAEPLWAAAVGCTQKEAREIVRRSMIHGYVPEPLRVAALVARAVPATGPRTPASPTVSPRNRSSRRNR
ncbi:MAG: DUF99 family protein [Thermoplasmata archaeon]|nr:DUF99 family protein [Thermoplasmata archaeon]